MTDDRRVQITAIWVEGATDEERRSLTHLADAVKEDMKALWSKNYRLADLRVDCAWMPRLGKREEFDDPQPGYVSVDPEHPFANLPQGVNIFPEGHPLSDLEAAYRRGDVESFEELSLELKGELEAGF